MNPATETPTKQQSENKFLSRDDFLGHAGVLREKEVDIKDLGVLLISEITGDVRAELIGQQFSGMIGDVKKFDRKAYERTLIQAGVIDPDSPPGGRRPMFRPGDMDRVMRLGAGKITEIVDAIEELSGLGDHSGAAEGNSETTPNGAGTS